MVAAANAIATRPYEYGGGHGSFDDTGYDCSGSVSYVLHAMERLDVPADSSELMSYGEPGPGEHVTVYANPSHAYMVIDGPHASTPRAARRTARAGSLRHGRAPATWRATPPVSSGYTLPGVDVEQLKERSRAQWSRGNYPALADAPRRPGRSWMPARSRPDRRCWTWPREPAI